MNRRSMCLGLAIVSVLASSLCSFPVQAQGKYPQRPIRVVIPFVPGGNTDIIGRRFAVRMSPLLGQQLVIDNKAGADGAIGTAEVARAKPDGYTTMIGTASTHAINPLTMANPGYDPVKDFAPIAVIGIGPLAIAVHPSGAKSLQELIEQMRANPGKYSYGTPGVGSLNHLTGELFRKQTGGLDMVHIPYKGGGQSVQDLIAGQIPLSVVTFSSAITHHRSGRLRILAVFSEKRAKAAPDVPTASEAGTPGVLGYTFNVFCAPTGTPGPIIDQLYESTAKVMSDEAFQQELYNQAIEPVTDSNPAKAAQLVKDEIGKWAAVLKAIGGKVQ